MTTDGAALPASPFKGLQYYGIEDTAIYAGREQEIIECARQIAESEHRITILHGATGSGKSSFLRAGLIPLLERHEHAFQFPRREHNEIMFIRSTGAPLLALADSIHEFARRKISLKTPIGPRSLDLPSALLGHHNDLKAFRAHVGENAEHLVESLVFLTGALPRTLVLVIDQAEEVHTLSTDSAVGSAARFFTALALLSRIRCDLRLVLSIRTEYFGRFRNELKRRHAKMTAIADYMLYELDRDGLIRAIKRPAEIPHYKFQFEPNLPEKIADTFIKSAPTGGVLPAVQIACSELYAPAIKQPELLPLEITAFKLNNLGPIDEMISRYIDRVLMDALEKSDVPWDQWPLEVHKWRRVLAAFGHVQADGSVTTKLLSPGDLRARAIEQGCRGLLEPLITYLADDKRRIMRHIDAADPADVRYSLGHDVLGLILQKHPARHDYASDLLLRRTRFQSTVIFGVVMGAFTVGIALTEIALPLASPFAAFALFVCVQWLRRAGDATATPHQLVPLIRHLDVPELLKLREDHLLWDWLARNVRFSQQVEQIAEYPFQPADADTARVARPATESSGIKLATVTVVAAAALLFLGDGAVALLTTLPVPVSPVVEPQDPPDNMPPIEPTPRPEPRMPPIEPTPRPEPRASTCHSVSSCFASWVGCSGEWTCHSGSPCSKGSCISPLPDP